MMNLIRVLLPQKELWAGEPAGAQNGMMVPVLQLHHHSCWRNSILITLQDERKILPTSQRSSDGTTGEIQRKDTLTGSLRGFPGLRAKLGMKPWLGPQLRWGALEYAGGGEISIEDHCSAHTEESQPGMMRSQQPTRAMCCQ